jgi:hypothetical protein
MRRFCYSLFVTIYLLAACSPAQVYLLSTPEKAYQTAHHAILINDMDLYRRCFLKTEDQEAVKQLQSLGGFPKRVKFLKHDVIEKDIINESEVNLKVREAGERTSSAGEASYYFISTALINYLKTADGWKVQSTTTISVQKATKIGDNYAPTDQNTDSKVTTNQGDGE